MKKILLNLSTLAFIAVAVAGATYAYFSDSETSTGNTFSAGTLDLKTNDADGTTTSYKLTDIKPGAWDLAGQVVLKNAGTVKGHAWLEIVNVTNSENGCNSAETKASDTTCGTEEGELGSLAKASFQQNVAPWTRFGGSQSIDLSEGVKVDLFDLNPGDSMPLVVYGVWTNGGANDNVAQSDGVQFDVVFHLDQAVN